MALSPFFRYDPFTPRGFNDFSSITPYFRDMMSDSRLGFDIKEDEGKYHISVDLPGVKPSDMKVEVENDNKVLHIYGGRKVTKGDSVTETRFDKRFTIGENIDIEKMSANLHDGVLELEAPKREETRPKTRTIEVSEGRQMLENQPAEEQQQQQEE
ncbi:hypothetical protein MPSEU_000057400 [Mayamaea pseudoterrestris]|nr:hypothetical protein MPSEU_000057400 [Mayamaea pseudoterrestris]